MRYNGTMACSGKDRWHTVCDEDCRQGWNRDAVVSFAGHNQTAGSGWGAGAFD
ncbi:hypothetical protein THTE_0260 [Thermogutta terrifontis]|uniref:Uncharacterized protein n=1 Tax=Thermogutta terrifontis TaxID=1331910 RepID=A0A286RA84_9BACT|nr:hypothetical protein THTE_0260 [Thermogutta terrifontis]